MTDRKRKPLPDDPGRAPAARIVTVIGGSLTESGSLNQTTQLTFNVFGFKPGKDMILNQEWEMVF